MLLAAAVLRFIAAWDALIAWCKTGMAWPRPLSLIVCHDLYYSPELAITST